MRLTAFVLLAILISACLGSVESDSRRAIQALYDAWSKAYPQNDASKLLTILAPDYTLTTVTGDKITRKDYEAALNLRGAGPKDSKKYRTRITALTLTGNQADVLCVEQITSEDKDSASRKPIFVLHEHLYSDTWIRAGGRWLLACTVTLQERTTTKPR